MSYKWYVVHVYSGSEKRVKETIEEQMKSKNMEEFIEEILVPTEEILEIRKGAKVKTEKKFFPGYLLIKMNMTDESWHFVKSQPKVTNFLGAKGKPIALSSIEAKRLIEQITERVERPRSNVIFEIGEEVRVSDGPFQSFNGLVEEIDSVKSLSRGVYARKKLKKGDIITLDDVFFAMPLLNKQLDSGSFKKGIVLKANVLSKMKKQQVLLLMLQII